jgi:hypothetical protein
MSSTPKQFFQVGNKTVMILNYEIAKKFNYETYFTQSIIDDDTIILKSIKKAEGNQPLNQHPVSETTPLNQQSSDLKVI